MGYKYNGQISGKNDWSGILDQDAANYLGGDGKNVFRYFICHCQLKRDDIIDVRGDVDNYRKGDGEGGFDDLYDVFDSNRNKRYCRNCFDSYYGHKREMDNIDIGYYDSSTWYCSDEICYTFDKNNITGVDQYITQLEETVGKYMTSYEIVDNVGPMDPYSGSAQLRPLDNVGSGQTSSLPLRSLVAHLLPSELRSGSLQITYSYVLPEDVSHTDKQLIARLCLCKQISYCLRKNGSCFFSVGY